MVTIRTYRYLRVAIVAMVVLIAVAVVRELIVGLGQLGSISEYYYSPARNVFVGALVGVGVCLVAIKGRGADDALLNTAGMLAPVVAFVPTPLRDPSVDGWFSYRLPPGAEDGVVSSIVSLLALGVIVLVFAWTTVRTVPSRQRGLAVRGHRVATLIVVAGGVWFVVHRESFLLGAHFVAALGLFAALTVVSWHAAALATGERRDVPMPMAAMRPERRARIYRVVSLGLAAVAAAGVVLGVLDQLGSTPFRSWLFWVESAMLALFVVFWLVQTAEYWRDGAPDDGAGAPT